MSHSSSEARSDGDDDAEPGQSRVTRAKRPCPRVAMGAALLGHHPRPPLPPPDEPQRGDLPQGREGGHRGALQPRHAVRPLAPVPHRIPALRSLLLMNLKEETSLRAAREAIAGLYNHATPFGPSRRFPTGEVYVCLDRVPLAQTMQRIVQPLVTVEAAGVYGEQLVDACSNYIGRISSALLDLTRVEDRPGISPILYDRAIFESVFLLTWPEP
ncbi:hypothetical protein TRIUR3_14795 [Triticum urartu]|uniref:Uncharacterized protein n=1 Tax=Triticum urartu TaxID=4572 RepID=M8AXS5_TRIUA|nr:hypothetical protein TRIUR3_14795 [Triticum urartu]